MTSSVPCRSSSVATPIVALALVMTRRIPVTTPPITMRCWSISSPRSPLYAVTYAAHLGGQLAERVVGQVEPEQLLLPAQPLAGRRLRGRRQRPLQGLRVRRSRRTATPGRSTGRAAPPAPAAIASSSATSSWAGWPNRPSAPTLISDSSTRLLTRRRSTRAQRSASERKSPSASRAAMIDSIAPCADVLDGQQPEADRVALDREVEAADVDVRRPDLDAQPPALGDRGRHLLGVVAEGGEHAGHVLDRVVRLQVRGLVRDQAVARGVRLVEAVALERLERLEHGLDDLRA